jgi:O-antigen/teichoic acid export membrane protein
MLTLPLKRRLTQNTAIKLGSELIGRAASFVLMVLAARHLGETDFGWYNYGLALGFVLAQLADMGLQVLVSREVAVHDRQAQVQVRTAFQIKLGLSVLVIALLLLFTQSQATSIRSSLRLLGLMLLSQTYLEFVGYVFRGQQALWQEAWLLAGARVLSAVIGVGVLALGGGLAELTMSGVVVILAVTLWGLGQLRRAGWLQKPATPAAAPLESHWLPLFQQALPLGIAIFLSIAYTRLAVLLLQYRLDETAVAQFSAAARLVEPMQIIPASVLAAAFPVLSLAWQQDVRRAKRLGWQLGAMLASGGFILALAGWLSAAWLIPWLYGDAYGPTIMVFQLLAFTIPPAFINFSLTHHLIARNQQALIVWFNVVMLALHAFFIWTFVPRWGVVTPAISTIIAECFLLVACLLTLRFTPEK